MPDILGRLPGRGIWVSSQRGALDLAVKKKLFAKAARAKVTVPEDLTAEVARQLEGRVISLLAMARKAGLAVAGYEKARSALDAGAYVLMQASDGSPRGKTKLKPPPDGGVFIGCLTAHEMGLAFGRDHVIHAALSAGGLTTRIVEEAARLDGLRDEGTMADAVGKEL